MKDIIVKDLEKSSTGTAQIIRIAFREYENSRFLDIRLHYDDSGDWKVTRKGITIQIPMLPALLKGIEEAIEVAKKEGLFTADDTESK